MDNNTKVLAQVPLFEGLSSQQLSVIAFTGSWRSFMPGETIIEKGQPGDTAYVILTGQALTPSATPNGEPERLGPGTLIGEPAMFSPTNYRSTVIAERGVGTISLTTDTLRRILQRDPTIGPQLANAIKGRLKSMSSTLERLERGLAGDG